MKIVTPELSAHLGGETTTLARLLKITRATDGVVLRLSDHDANIAFDDGAPALTILKQWLPSVTPVTPWWATADTFVVNTFAGDTFNSHIDNWGAVDQWEASLMFAGNGGGGNATFLGSASIPVAGVTFETAVNLHADTVGATGEVRTGIANGTVWASVDSYIGFNFVKTYGPWATNWQLRVSNGVSSTTVDSGVPNPDTIQAGNQGPAGFAEPKTKLKFVVSDDRSVVRFFINDIFVGSITTNIPTVNLGLSNVCTSSGFGGTIYFRTEGLTASALVTPAGGTYLGDSGLTFSAAEFKSDASPDNLSITGFLQDSGINEQDVRARLFDNATFEFRIVNWADTTQGALKLLKGTVGDIVMTNGAYQMELRGLTQQLTTTLGSTYGPVCRAELFGGGAENIDPSNHWKCRLNRADWVQTGSVVSSPDSVSIVPNTSGSPAISFVMRGSATPTVVAPAGWFNDGLITFTSGVLNGYSFEIASWDGITLTLFAGAPMPFSPAAADTFEIEPGCDKTAPTCHSKFNNIVNFAGEADIPGLNVIGAVSRAQIKD